MTKFAKRFFYQIWCFFSFAVRFVPTAMSLRRAGRAGVGGA